MEIYLTRALNLGSTKSLTLPDLSNCVDSPIPLYKDNIFSISEEFLALSKIKIKASLLRLVKGIKYNTLRFSNFSALAKIDFDKVSSYFLSPYFLPTFSLVFN